MRSDLLGRPSLLLAALALAVTAAPALGKVFLSRSEALELAFPDAERVESRTFVLSDEQAASVEALAGPLDSRLVTFYTAHGEGGVQGHALIDVHRVRTMAEALLIVLETDGAVRSLKLLAFHEPQEYAPPPRWLDRFIGRRVSGRSEIDAIAGSTLTSRAVGGAVRRATALHRVLLRDDESAGRED